MMRALFFSALAVVSCASRDAPPPAQPAAPPPATAADPLDEKLRHCPLTVDSARAEVRDVDGGVELLVRVQTKEQLEELEKRVHHIEEFAKTNGHAGGRHNTGKGGGSMRNCPVVSQKTTIEDQPIESGFRIVVRPNDPAEVDALRAETRKRLAALTPP